MWSVNSIRKPHFFTNACAIIQTVNAHPKHVVVALRMAGIAGQDKLNGIFEYLSEGHRWSMSIYRTRHEFTPDTVRAEVSKGADGFILGIPGTEDALAEVAKTDLPAVILNISPGALARRKAGVVLIKSDSEAVGREAANTLLSQGVFKSYGYAGYHTNDDWSVERGRSFRDILQKAGFIGRMFDVAHYPDRTEDRATLVSWLKSLPKPCGILASCDDRAYEIVDVCREIGIRIPQEIGILGVNNDPILCENSDPKISSIQPDFKREGYLAARAIDRMPRERTICVGVKQVVHRESTYPMSNSGKLVQKALAYIEKNATRKTTVPDVAAHLRVSRSLLDLRFRELQGESVHAAILKRRLSEVKRRLLATHDSIEKISSDCGWDNVNSLKNSFHKATGKSMREWRTSPL